MTPSAGVLHVFDLDSTLHRSTASLEIATALDCRDEVLELEGQLERGEISAGIFAAQTHHLWSTKAPLTHEVLQDVLDRTPWMDGLARVCTDIQGRGERSMVISTAPAFYVEQMRARFGVDHVVGMPFPRHPFNGEPFDAGAALRPTAKVDEVRRVYNLLAVTDPRMELVAYGSSDVPLFRSLPGIPPAYGMSVSVAVNSKPPQRAGEHDLRLLADVTYDGTDMWPAYIRGRRLLRHAEDPIQFGAVS